MINITFKPEELDLVLQALSTQPYRSVVGVIQNIVNQAQAQQLKREEVK
jgi:hypothetical protein